MIRKRRFFCQVCLNTRSLSKIEAHKMAIEPTGICQHCGQEVCNSCWDNTLCRMVKNKALNHEGERI